MTDFLKSLAAASSGGSPLYSDYPIVGGVHESRLKRNMRAIPAFFLHSWRTSSLGFKIMSFISLSLFGLLIGSQIRDTAGFHPPRILPEVRPLPRSLLTNGLVARRDTPCTNSEPCILAAVADLDTRSKIDDAYQSYLALGLLKMPSPYSVEWGNATHSIVGKLAEGGRGMELSELVLYGGRLLAFDDRTGITFTLMAKEHQGSLRASVQGVPELVARKGIDLDLNATTIDPVAKLIIPEGNGADSSKGMKIEWAARKDNDLYIGSFGKEFTTPNGDRIVSNNSLWVAKWEGGASLSHEDWTSKYNALREATGTTHPGYMIHEAVNWSPHMRRWFFLPRRVSVLPYDDKADETRGSNLIIIASEDFKKIETREVRFKNHIPARGFSSFKFLPGTKDRQIVALRTEESEGDKTQSTYVSIFDINGTVLYGEELMSGTYKFEGIEIW